MHLTIKLFILWWLIFYFDITMTSFLNPHFPFFMCDKHSVIISKVHNESILFLNSSINFNKIFTKIYCNIDMKEMKILMIDMILHFSFIYNPEKLQL
jgi:hypothetical protein